MSRWIAPLLFCGTLAFSSVALAAEPDTIVTLKNGDMARGTLIEKTTGDHVTIQLPSGESRTFPWADVASVAPITASPPVAPPPPVAPAPPVAPPPGAIVHLESDDPKASVARLAGRGQGSFTTGNGYGSMTLEVLDMVCHAPCGRFVPAGSYRISGEGLMDTDEFGVPDSGELTVHAHMASRVRHNGGRFALFVGIPFLIGGATMFVLGAVLGTATANGSIDLRPMMFGVGGALLGLGAIGTALGIYFLATSSSDVRVTPGNSPTAVLARGGTFVF
jgi:hypothetical protein